MPTQDIYLTSGAARKLMLGNRVVTLKKGNRVQMLLGKRAAGKAIRALAWLGSEHAAVALKVLKQKSLAMNGTHCDCHAQHCPTD